MESKLLFTVKTPPMSLSLHPSIDSHIVLSIWSPVVFRKDLPRLPGEREVTGVDWNGVSPKSSCQNVGRSIRKTIRGKNRIRRLANDMSCTNTPRSNYRSLIVTFRSSYNGCESRNNGKRKSSNWTPLSLCVEEILHG